MIKSFRHKRLARFFSYSERRGIDAKQADRIRRILDRLDAATKPEDMNISGSRVSWSLGQSQKAGTRHRCRGTGGSRSSLKLETLLEWIWRIITDEEPARPETQTHPPGRGIAGRCAAALKMSQTELARRLGVSRLSVSELLLEKRALSADMAVRLGKLTNTAPESWLRMQSALDLWELEQDPKRYRDIVSVAA